MTLAKLMSMVGFQPGRAEVYQRKVGELDTWGFRDTMVGMVGWWFGVTSGERVLALGWTPGSANQRNAEIRRAIRLHMHPAVPQVIA